MAKTGETAEARGKLPDLAGRVATKGTRIVVQRRGQPLAVLIGLDEYSRLPDAEGNHLLSLLRCWNDRRRWWLLLAGFGRAMEIRWMDSPGC